MKVSITTQTNPNRQELHEFFESTFNDLNDADSQKFTAENSQTRLEEWFDLSATLENAKGNGSIVEARDQDGKLIGAAFVGKQSPVSWPDGKKAEAFILAVAKNMRQQGIGKQLMEAVEEAAKNMGAKKIITNTHVLMDTIQRFYTQLGYTKMGILENYYDNGHAIFFYKDLE